MIDSVKRWAGVFFTTFFLILMLYTVDLEASVNALKNADPFFLLLAFISASTPLIIYSVVWRKVLEWSGTEFSFFTTFRLVLANTFVNNITPFGNIGGEAAATYIISKITEKNYAESFTPVFTASIINFSPLLTFLIIGGLYTQLYAVLLVPVMLYTGWKISINLSIFPDFFRDFREDLKTSWASLDLSLRKILPFLFLTHFAAVFDILSIGLIGYAFGFEILSLTLFIVVPLARVANYVPTPGGTGPYEIALSGLLAYFFPIGISEAVIVAVVYRVLTYYTGLITGFFALNSFPVEKLI